MTASRERTALAVVLGTALVVNLVTGARSPIAWQDEVQVVDPVFRWLSGAGLETRSYPWDPDVAGVMALGRPHTWLLAAWMKVFGTGMLAARSLNHLLITGAAVAMWCGARRLGAVTRPWLRIALAATVVTGFGITRTYRSGRYDVEGIVLVALAFAALAIAPALRRRVVLLAIGIAAPFCGLQLMPYGALIAGLGLACFGRKRLVDAVVTGAGMAAGYGLFHVLHTVAGTRETLIEHMARGGLRSDLGTRAHHLFGSMPGVFVTDPSAGALAAAAVIAAVWCVRRGNSDVRPAIFAVLALLVIPAGMAMAGRYPSYYTWMAFLPVAVGAVAQLDRAFAHEGRSIRIAGWGLLAAACAGLPLRTAVTGIQWEARDPARADAFIAAHVQPGDHVLAGFQAYYGLRDRAATLSLGRHLDVLDATARADVDLILASERDAARMVERVGGEWTEVGRLAPASPALVLFEESGRRGPVQRLARIRLGAGEVYQLVALRRAQ